jgi:hypothetical protein
MRNGREEMKPQVAERESHPHTLMAYISGPAGVNHSSLRSGHLSTTGTLLVLSHSDPYRLW